MLDIEILRITWWVLLGVLIIGFALSDGFDLGAAILFPFVTKNEEERETVLNAIGPFWEGNQAWLILGAGAIFAAWPYVYAVAFSTFYFLILLLLLTIGISRPVSFKYRSKIKNYVWRRFWDALVFIGGFCPAIIFGLLIGNIFQGIPFYLDEDLRIFYADSFLGLFNFFAWWCALTSLFMLTMHGGAYLGMKTFDPIRSRAIFWSKISAFLLILLFAGGGFWLAFHLTGYEVVGEINHYGFSNPLYKQVVPKVGAWIQNFYRYPLAIVAPLLGFIGAIGLLFTINFGKGRCAFLCSCLSIIGIISSVGISLFPFLLPSSVNLRSSLLVWDASSSDLTLLLMLVAVIIFMPIILLYTSWVYYVFRGKVLPTQKIK